ncbi:MAG: NupC/NupG family nucleoside CNT transporter [Alphaproteobacteria bacterium]
MIFAAWALSENRRRVKLRTIVGGLALQIVLAVLLLKAPIFRDGLLALNGLVAALQEATSAGARFVFGYLAGGTPPYKPEGGAGSFLLAFQALPLVLVISALSALLYHWRILPLVVKGFAWALQKTLGIGGTAGVGVAANVFVGMVEAPLLVRPYLKTIGRSDLFVIMVAGMATIAGTVMVLYATFLKDIIPDAIGHLLTASILSAPAAVVIARLMVPGGDTDAAEGGISLAGAHASTMDAITTGTLDGLKLLLNIIAMLIVLVALVTLANMILALLPEVGGAPLTLQMLLGYIMAPLAWLIGIPWAEAGVAGSLLGTKVVLNELIAYLDMAALPAEALAPRSRLILTYAMCGFANFASLGIMIGGLGAMAPERRGEIVSLGLKSILAGLMATSMTGALVGLLAF